MCFDTMDRVAALKGLSNAEFRVLMNLAHRRNSKTGACFPSIAKISKDTEIGKRQLQRVLNNLEEKGHIKREHRQTNKAFASNQYTFPSLHGAMEDSTVGAQKSIGGGEMVPNGYGPDVPQNKEATTKKKKKKNNEPALSANTASTFKKKKLYERWERSVEKYYGQKVILRPEDKLNLQRIVETFGGSSPNSELALEQIIRNWNSYTTYCKTKAGSYSLPEVPQVGFLTRFIQEAVNYLIESRKPKENSAGGLTKHKISG